MRTCTSPHPRVHPILGTPSRSPQARTPADELGSTCAASAPTSPARCTHAGQGGAAGVVPGPPQPYPPSVANPSPQRPINPAADRASSQTPPTAALCSTRSEQTNGGNRIRRGQPGKPGPLYSAGRGTWDVTRDTSGRPAPSRQVLQGQAQWAAVSGAPHMGAVLTVFSDFQKESPGGRGPAGLKLTLLFQLGKSLDLSG